MSATSVLLQILILKIYFSQDEEVLETLPDTTERIKHGPVEKKILGRSGAGRWEERQAIFTKSAFFLAKRDDDKVRREIVGDECFLC